MLSDEGGVVRTVSSPSVRRALLSRGTFPLRAAADLRGVARFAVRTRFFAALFARLSVFRPLGRLAELRFPARFRPDRAAAPRGLALRLAIVPSFRNLDSLAISVVPSDAYRNSQIPRGGPAPGRYTGKRAT